MTYQSRPVPPVSPERYDTSHNLLLWLSNQFNRSGDIYRASIYGSDVYVVSDPEFVDHILRKNWQNYKKGFAIKRIGLLLGNGLMVSESGFWKSQRQMIQPAFHDDAIPALIKVIADANAALLQQWKQAAAINEKVNVTRDISHMILKIVLLSIFGDDYEQVAPQFEILSVESARNMQFAETFRPLRRMVLQVALQRRKQNSKATDLLGLLMSARDRKSGQSMPDSQVVNEVITLVVAGHETTASTLNWAWYLLSQNPAAEEKLSYELDTSCGGASSSLPDLARFTYTRRVIQETLRLYPAGWLLTRRALKDDQLGNYYVPAGTEIYISPYLIQRHPALWDAPDEFNPDRFEPVASSNRHPLAMLPFSAGPRKCIAESLARVEMQMHLMILAKELRLRSGINQKIQLDAGVNLRNEFDFIMTPEMKAPVHLRASQSPEVASAYP